MHMGVYLCVLAWRTKEREQFINLLKSRKNEMSENAADAATARFKLWPSG